MTQNFKNRCSESPSKIFQVNMTMGELFTVIQNQVSLAEDNVVVEVATTLFRTGRAKYATR